MLRSRVALVAVFALGCSLTGCAGAIPETAGTAIELPELPTDTPSTAVPQPTPDAGLPAGQSPSGGATSPAAPGDMSATDPVGATTKDCVIVAAGVSSILLAPLSLLGVTDSDKVDRLHDQIDDLQSMVPPELDEDFDQLQEVVAASTRDGEGFDESAYRAAVSPIEDWLHRHCSDHDE